MLQSMDSQRVGHDWVNNLIKYNKGKKWLKIYMPKCQQHTFLMSYLFSYHGDSDGKESACSVGDLGSIPGPGRFPGEGNSDSLQYSCLKKSMDRRAWRGYSPRGIKESDTTEATNTFTFHYFLIFSKFSIMWKFGNFYIDYWLFLLTTIFIIRNVSTKLHTDIGRNIFLNFKSLYQRGVFVTNPSSLIVAKWPTVV